MSFAKRLVCPRCNENYPLNKPHNLCFCGAPLLVEYDLEQAKKELSSNFFIERPFDMWRYRELLPIQNSENIVSLGEGGTPIFALAKWGKKVGLTNLLVKDEALNPTGSFKARGASCGLSRALELGIKEIAMPTAGNAGSAWAAYAAKANLKFHTAMPKDTPPLIMQECRYFGANITEVDGLISDAGAYIKAEATKNNWFEVATLKEPYRIEGKKTMGYELFEQFNSEMPDVVVYPTGGGVGLIGIWKAYQELLALGWLKNEKPPKMIVVQAEGCAPIVKAFNEKKKKAKPWPGAKTKAYGIRVPQALGDFLVLDAVYKSDGYALAVSEEQIEEHVQQIALAEGLLLCPEAAAAFACLPILLEQGVISPDHQTVVINTGSGLKYF